MNWFPAAILSVLGWGTADLFYKIGSDEEDRYSHLRIAVWVGLIMGVSALALLPFSESGLSFSALVKNAVRYSPASLCYIISMVIGYAGLRYLELSIVSPVQNASGALSAICMLVYFMAVGRIRAFSEEFSVLDIIGTVLVTAGFIALAVVEQKLSKEETDRRYRFGALALLFPLLYCVFDTIGTAADGIILDAETGLGLGEIDVIILYGLTFFAAGLIIWIFLWVKEKKPYQPFKKCEMPKMLAALCEEFGQIFYVFAMAENPVLAAPMVASYCIVSMILSRLFIHEKLKLPQYLCIVLVIAGIILLGISEGLSA